MAAEPRTTPMMKQYLGWKERYPGCLLFFRMGDFYETFLDDAKIVAKELDLALTARDKDKTLPMAGVPWHSAESYLAKLTRKGYSVAICEQMSEPDGRTLVERRVVRVVTPGTYLAEDGAEAPTLAAVLPGRHSWAMGWLQPTSARVSLFEGSEKAVSDLLESLKPAEVLLPAGSSLTGPWRRLELPKPRFEPAAGASHLCRKWGLETLGGFGLSDDGPLAGLAGALVTYLEETSFSQGGHITGLQVLSPSGVLTLDGNALAHLELIGTDGSLYDLLNRTMTACGGRLLKRWLMRPSGDLVEIGKRGDAVAALKEAGPEGLQPLFEGVRDMERALARLHTGLASPRDLGALAETLAAYGPLHRVYSGLLPFMPLPDPEETAALGQQLSRTLAQPLPRLLGQGPLIAPGVDEDLDGWRALSERGEQWIEAYTESQKELLGLNRLKVTYNRVFGYTLEISKSQLIGLELPAEYERRQTLATAERFVTPRLKEFETKRLQAEGAIAVLERRLFEELVSACRALTGPLQRLAEGLAQLDCLTALALVAKEGRWVRPALGGKAIVLKGARHPLVEAALGGEPFVPFSVTLDRTNRLALVTGPNMAGKSTFLRALGVLQVLAQMGSFVPAEEAVLPPVDRLFTRVGARDELTRGRSTFMVEMVETAEILNNATGRSLVILDEVGRGTATYDGMSIAWALLEYLSALGEKAPLALFATHYHELTGLEGALEGLFNLSMDVTEGPKGPLFTHRLVAGPASRSYGVEVARMAGLPRQVIHRASQLLGQLEDQAPKSDGARQTPLFDVESDRLVDRLAVLDPDALSPKEALELVYDLQAQAQALRSGS